MGRVQEKSPTLDDWCRAYQLAAQIKAIKPWRYMDETHIFAVKDPVSGRLGFISITGLLVEYYAVSLYLDPVGLYEFWAAQEADFRAYPESMFEAPQLQLSFEDRIHLNKPDRDIIKNLGLKFRGRHAWPMFRSFRGGFIPWYLEAEELRFLTVGLEQLLDVAPRLEADRELFNVNDEVSYFARVAEGRGRRTRWKDTVLAVPPPTDVTLKIYPFGDLLDQCEHLDTIDGQFELDFFALPLQVGKRGTRTRFLYMLLLVDAVNGTIMDYETLTVDTSIWDLWARVPGYIVALFIKIGAVPATIYVRSPTLHRFVERLAEEISFGAELADALPELDSAKQELIDYMFGT